LANSREKIRRLATVREVLPGAMFRLELETGEVLLAHVAEEARKLVVRIVPGDSVIVEVSEMDLARGRIVKKA
jgi:translation initiation factor IF-1